MKMTRRRKPEHIFKYVMICNDEKASLYAWQAYETIALYSYPGSHNHVASMRIGIIKAP